jgi:2',3'-cyclic-nucleotide 2'-phosphodiesterase (5'-nucleotidase family)
MTTMEFNSDSMISKLQRNRKRGKRRKIGIFGLTTTEIVDNSSPCSDVHFTVYINEAKAAVKAFEQQGIKKIIALTHIGLNDGEEVTLMLNYLNQFLKSLAKNRQSFSRQMSTKFSRYSG